MSSQTLGILIGGLLAAVLYGLTGLSSKASIQAGIGLGIYLLIIGLSIAAVGGVLFFFLPDRTVNWLSGLHAVGVGLTWGIGTASVGIALSIFRVPLSKLVPLYNMNTLIAVLLSLWLFAEWREVRGVQLLLGSVFIIAGGILVATAS